jgi:membrane associated rhomboid family serine protease
MAFRIKFNSPVILSFALICTSVLIADRFLLGNLMPYFTIMPSVNWSNPFSFLTMVTHIFGHGSLEHLIGNLTFILLLGPIIEEKYGSQQMIYMILFTAFITGIINILFFNTGLLGASGIVFMLILLVSFTNVRKGEIPLTFILVTFLFVGKELIQSVGDNQISETAHIIGGICGGIFGFKNAR